LIESGIGLRPICIDPLWRISYKKQNRRKTMNIQIFGTSKCFDTKKAQRYFKERGIRFQMIDLKEKGMSRGEFDNVKRAVGGWANLVDRNAKDKQTLALLDALVDWQQEDKLFENQQLLKTPIVRNGRQATVGYQPDVWKGWE
jgi:arsenate reductase-like glutaredoxin family protein